MKQFQPYKWKPSQYPRVHASLNGKTTACGKDITSGWKEVNGYTTCQRCKVALRNRVIS